MEVQEESGNAPSGGGRPSMQYRYNYDYRTVAVVYGHQLRGEATYIRWPLIWTVKSCGKRQEYMEEIGPESFDSALMRVFAASAIPG